MATHARRCVSILVALLLGPTVARKTPIKVFLLAGQSNMVGQGSIEHLKRLIANDCLCRDEYRTLWNGTDFVERDDVYMRYTRTDSSGSYTSDGKLAVGHGFAARGKFGAEVGFGWTIGDALKGEDIILIKSAYGGRSLAVDFRPPSSGTGNYSDVKPGPNYYGWEYRQMMNDFHRSLNNLTAIYPDYDAESGYELAGLVWFQGWSDIIRWPFVEEYGFNLINFIRDVRKELNAPYLPFVIGELGQHGVASSYHGPGDDVWDQAMALRVIELGVTRLKEFQSNTIFARTAPYAVMNGTTYDGIHHYFGRADTYFHIGKAFGRGMLHLMNVAKIVETDHSSSFLENFSFSHPFSSQA